MKKQYRKLAAIVLTAVSLCVGAFAAGMQPDENGHVVSEEYGVSFTLPANMIYQPQSDAEQYVTPSGNTLILFDAEPLDPDRSVAEQAEEFIVYGRQMLLAMGIPMSPTVKNTHKTYAAVSGEEVEMSIEEAGIKIAFTAFCFDHDGDLCVILCLSAGDEIDFEGICDSIAFPTDETGAEEDIVPYTDGDVRISFKVGDSTLYINGAKVPVETPYVVGDGVTLVPVRVITEAFGAKVGWDDATKTVTVGYEGVTLSLSIGSVNAEINGRLTKLAAAPELSGSGVTMVPLRFICEAFGAEVGYDADTERILVGLDRTEAESGDVIGHGVKEKYIGSSEDGWSFENIGGLAFGEEDEGSVMLTDNSGNMYVVETADRPAKYDFDKDYEETLEDYSENSRIFLNAKHDDGAHPWYEIHYKQYYGSDGYYCAERLYVTETKLFRVGAIVMSDVDGAVETAVAVLDTFRLQFDPDSSYDLYPSYDAEKFKEYKIDEVGITVRAPESLNVSLAGGYYGASKNNIVVGSDQRTAAMVSITFYSTEDAGDMRDTLMASNALETYLLDGARVITEKPREYDYLDTKAYGYEFSCEDFGGHCVYGRQTVVCIGAYTYLINVSMPTRALLDAVYDGIAIKPLEPKKEGRILLTEKTPGDPKKTSAQCVGGFGLTASDGFIWEEPTTSYNANYIRHTLSGVLGSAALASVTLRIDETGTLGFKPYDGMTPEQIAAMDLARLIDEDKDADTSADEGLETVVTPITSVTVGDIPCACVVTAQKQSGFRYVNRYYYFVLDGKPCRLYAAVNDLCDTDNTRALITDIIASMKADK